MTIISEKEGKITEEGRFPCAFYKKVKALIPSNFSFSGVGCKRDVLVSEVH